MKYRLFALLMLAAGMACAEEAKEEWNETSLSNETIENSESAIQL